MEYWELNLDWPGARQMPYLLYPVAPVPVVSFVFHYLLGVLEVKPKHIQATLAKGYL